VPTQDAYKVERREVGHITPQMVRAALMPRGDFLELVDRCLEETRVALGVDLTEKLRPVAETMPHFPLGTWMHAERGCGCVVGEYLVVADLIDRADAVPDPDTGRPERVNIVSVLSAQPDGQALEWFGEAIDSEVRVRLRARNGESFPVVVFVDDEEATT
jgi:hypothetical protein